MTNNAAEPPLVGVYHPPPHPTENRCGTSTMYGYLRYVLHPNHKVAYFGRMYGYLRYVLHPNHKVAYEFVLGNVIFPEDWDAHLKSNMYLHRFYSSAPASAKYSPQGKGTPAAGSQAQKSAAKKEATKEVLQYHRNLPAHGLRETAHAHRPDDMIFNRTGMARMLYSVLDGVMVSLVECLARVGHFGCLDLESLFPGRVGSKKP
ncbi:unnamed protein product [Miscanthus lutarioriparius]|uniref:Uncharacterized protein n=1 Tax=Miscanthus lutarioriparius TaxID=422564 RepID=A0A811MNT9_9POAL|nr:unnamed protein product [Miscanthus lutarioriparius]